MSVGGKKDRHKGAVNIGILEACLIGLVAALGAVVLKHGVGFLGSMRVACAQSEPFFLPLFGLIGGGIAGLVIQLIVPEAGGSGIPQTKASLYGIPIPMGIRTAAVKAIGCVASLGSGLALGREGPTIHVAAALSAKLSGWIKTSPAHRTQLIAAGAGAGLAAAFNAPLAGVLFVLEELLQKMSGLAVGTTVVACFVASVTSRLVGVHSLDVNFSELAPKATFTPIDIPFLVLLGIAAGLLGAMFNKSIIAALSFNRDLVKQPLVVTCALAGLVSGLVVMLLPSELFRNYALLRQHLVEGQLGLELVMIAIAAQFFLTVIAYGSGAPGGLFAPSLTLGACLGHFFSITEQSLFHSGGDSGTFAVVGMGAVFCAVARVPMTAVVIIFEMTTDFNVVLPLMITCVISYLVAERLDPGSLYDQLLSWSGINLDDEESEQGLMSKVPARKIMQKRVETIDQDASLEEVETLFNSSRHQGFPVVDKGQKPVGIVTKPDLLDASKRKLDPKSPVTRFMTPNPVTVRPEETLAGVLYLIDKYGISRLPVVERGTLIGIITRSDVVSAESRIMGMRTTTSSASYVVYQTRSAESGEGRLVVAVGDPQTAEDLIRVAANIASGKHYELECLHVIQVPRDTDPSEAKVSDSVGRKIASLAERIGREYKLPVHTNVRVAHDVGVAISETLHDRDANLFVIRWTGSKKTNRSDLLVQKVLRDTNCPVLMVSKIRMLQEGSNFVVPVASFVEHEHALELADHMVQGAQSDSRLYLCQVHNHKRDEREDMEFDELFNSAQKKLSSPLKRMEVEATSPIRLLSNVRKDVSCDVLLFGLSRKTLLKSMQKGSFKKTLNRTSECSVVIVAEEFRRHHKRPPE